MTKIIDNLWGQARHKPRCTTELGRDLTKPAYNICENKESDRLCRYFIFATMIFTVLFSLSLCLQWLYSPVCVRPATEHLEQLNLVIEDLFIQSRI